MQVVAHPVNRYMFRGLADLTLNVALVHRFFDSFSLGLFDIKPRRWPADWKDQEVAARFITSAM